MIPWWVLVSLIAVIVLTEIIFFKYIRKEEYNFFEAKILSLMVSVVIVGVTFFLPAIIAFTETVKGKIPFGPIVFAWYYGIIFALGAFFEINYYYYFYKKLEDKKK